MGESATVLTELLLPLSHQWACTRQAYRDYMAAGKVFRYALVLRQANEAARNLLVRHGHLLPQSLNPAALQLIEHYNIWISEWDALYKYKAPGHDDVFVFLRGSFSARSGSRADSIHAGLARNSALEARCDKGRPSVFCSSAPKTMRIAAAPLIFCAPTSGTCVYALANGEISCLTIFISGAAITSFLICRDG